ncbi:MAG: tetratricopeptide repeat protein [Pseudomonadota bacterium]
MDGTSAPELEETGSPRAERAVRGAQATDLLVRLFGEDGAKEVRKTHLARRATVLGFLSIVADLLQVFDSFGSVLTAMAGALAIALAVMVALRVGPYARCASPLVTAVLAFIAFAGLQWTQARAEAPDGLIIKTLTEISARLSGVEAELQDLNAKVDALTETYVASNPGHDPASVDAYREAVEALLTSGDARKLRALELYNQGLTEGDESKQDQAITDLERLAEDQSRAVNDSAEQAAATWKQVGAFAFYNDTERALNAYHEAVRLTPDDLVAWNQLGHLLRRVGDLQGAEEAYRRLIADPLQTSQEWQAISLGNLGLIAQTRGDLDAAEDYHQRSLALEEELGRKEGMASELANLGNIAFDRGDVAGACANYRQAEGLFAEIGMRRELEQVRTLIAALCPDD